MFSPIRGLHHITAIAGAPQPNLDFYGGVLGLRLVKKTVNFDDPGTYHFYYGDGRGRPGSLLTFFPWPGAMEGHAGTGMVSATAFSIPDGSLDFWIERFDEEALEVASPQTRFGNPVLQLTDPDGLALELVAHAGAEVRSGWRGGPVPADHALRSFHGVTLGVRKLERTARLLTDTLGYQAAGQDGERHRFRAASDAPAGVIDLVRRDERGRMGVGTVHHVAFRARDEEEQLAWREEIERLGFRVTPVKDRQYFRSIYFREPGGVLFEVATDGPGFLIDETEETLGTALKLPEWLGPRRDQITQRLPDVRVPGAVNRHP